MPNMSSTQLNINFEEWRTVKGFEGCYEVSNLGRIYSYPRPYCKGGYSYGNKVGKGYFQCTLSNRGKRLQIKVHNLVYKTFVGEIPEGYEIHHINRIRTDNRLENLQLLTKEEHKLLHSKREIKSHNQSTETRKKMQNSSKSKKTVIMLDSNGDILNMFVSTKEAEKQTGLHRRNIASCCKGKRKTCGGFYFRFLDGAVPN